MYKMSQHFILGINARTLQPDENVYIFQVNDYFSECRYMVLASQIHAANTL